MYRNLLNILIVLTGLSLSMCRPARTISANDNLPEIHDLAELPALQKAVYVAPDGSKQVLSYEPSVETDIDDEPVMMDAMAVVPTGVARSAATASNGPCDASGCPDHCLFDGKKRLNAKTTISSKPLKTYATVKSFLTRFADHHPDTDMPAIIAGSDGRVDLEDFNAEIKKAWLFCYSKESDEDYHLVIGSLADKDDPNNRFMIVEVSGLPSSTAASRATLETVQTDFKSLKGTPNTCSSGYIWFGDGNQPVKIYVKGSVYWDTEHWNKNLGHIGAHGPASLGDRLTTVWEIHPITKIKKL